jgi:membrane-associated phospholipid phosphatase
MPALRTVVSLLCALAVIRPLGAQKTDTTASTKTLFTRSDAILAAGFAGLTVAMLPLDRALAIRLQDSSAQASRLLRNSTRDIQYFGDPGSVVIGVSLYAIGRVAGMRTVADLGFHGIEAVAASGLVTGLIKDVVGRARPYASADTSPHDFAFGRGLREGSRYQSFPSGHTTAAFAAAAVVTSESRRWWPHAPAVVGPVMYGGATLVGASRMYNNAHWASDVVLGAAIGTFTGLKVVRYNHIHPDNFMDRFFLEPSPADGRLIIGWRK